MIGVGEVARKGHLPGWLARPDATLVAAADTRPEGREAFLAAFPQGRWYASADELFGHEELDFADVCTPPALHAPIVRAALEAGCHVLCEKPLALSREEIAPLSGLAGEKERALVTVHNWKHAPALKRVWELAHSPFVEPLRSARWETLRTRPAAAAAGPGGNWRLDPAISGGGILVDHGWHAFYVVERLVPPPPGLAGRPARSAATGLLGARRHRPADARLGRREGGDSS